MLIKKLVNKTDSQKKCKVKNNLNNSFEPKKLVMWIIVSCFGLLFSFVLLVKLPELKISYPIAFDNDIVDVLFILIMMISVVLIAYSTTCPLG